MTVNIERESGGCVPEVSLHGLDIISILQGKNGKGMSQIMNARVRRSDSLCDFLVMVV